MLEVTVSNAMLEVTVSNAMLEVTVSNSVCRYRGVFVLSEE